MSKEKGPTAAAVADDPKPEDEEDHEPKSKKAKLEGDDDDGCDAAAAPSRKPAKKRKRKKKMFKELVEQMEFYFGDANLSKSKFMSEKLSEDPWIDLDVFLTFNKLSQMMQSFFGRLDSDDLYRALSSVPSELLEVSSKPRNRIRRRKPFDKGSRSPEEVERATVYVENLHPSSTIETLRASFSKYGDVAYVSLPRFKHNGAVKGFAFIEFVDEDGAGKALEIVDRVVRPDPDQLRTVKSYQEERALEKGEKRRRNSSGGNKKGDDSSSSSSSSMRVMFKADWRRLRNKYLNLQKKNMSAVKGRIRQMADPPPPSEAVAVKKEEPVAAAEREEFTKGVIVRFRLDEPIVDNGKAFKSRVRAAVMEPVKYVDARNGSTEVHVRCASAKQAETIAASKGIVVGAASGSGEVLAGREEEEYRQKIRRDREEKVSGRVKVQLPARRGKDRLVKKFEERVVKTTNSHKFFDAADDGLSC